MRSYRDLGSRLLAAGALAAVLSCGGDSGGKTEPTDNPVPVLTSLSRDTATVGTPQFDLTVRGTGFMTGAAGSLDGNLRPTTVTNDSTASLTVVAADLGNAGPHLVRLKNPEPTEGASAPLTLTVLPAPVPTIDSLSPDTLAAGGPNFTLHVYGTGFLPQSVIKWGVLQLATTRVDGKHLFATVAASLVATAGNSNVTVFTPAPGGGTSGARTFVVPPIPVVTGMDPDTIIRGPGPIPITVYGQHFSGVDSIWVGSQGLWHTLAPVTSNDTMATAILDRSWLDAIGDFHVRVFADGGGSTTAFFEIMNPVPVISGFSKDTLDGLASADTFMIYGSAFTESPIVKIDSATIFNVTRFGWDSIRVIVDAGHLFFGGVRDIRVIDSWDHQSSAPAPMAIISPVPVLDSIAAPATDTVASDRRHTIYGKQFRGNGVILVNGVPRAPSFINLERAVFPLYPSDVPAPGTVDIQIQTSGPGGGTSAAVTLTIVSTNPVPHLDSIVGTVEPGDPTGTVTLKGRNFVAGAVVHYRRTWGSFGVHSTPANVIDGGTLEFTVSDSAIAMAGHLAVTVENPPQTAGPSNTLMVEIRDARILRQGWYDKAYGWTVGDTARGLIYGTRNDFSTGVQLGVIEAFDPRTGTVVHSITLPGSALGIALAEDGDHLLAAVPVLHGIVRLDLQTWTAPTTWAPADTAPFRPLLVYPLAGGDSLYFAVGTDTMGGNPQFIVASGSTILTRHSTGGYVLDEIVLPLGHDSLLVVGGFKSFAYAVRWNGSGIDSLRLGPTRGSSYALAASGTRIIDGDGRSLDLQSGATAEAGLTGAVGPSQDPLGLFFITQTYDPSSGMPIHRLLRLDPTTLAILDTAEWAPIVQTTGMRPLLRWSSGGFAYQSDGGIWIVEFQPVP